MYTNNTTSPRQADLRLRRRRLRLRRRREKVEDKPASSSLFARLSPSAVNRLNTDALCRAQALGESVEADGWNVSAQQRLNQVEFLPLSIKFSADLIIYVSYNGGEVVDGKDGDTIELPAFMIPSGFSEDSEVQVAALPSIRDANVLNVEPLTVEDWELLETRAEFLEEGALLRQVSVVYAEQKLPLWVGGKDIAWVKVLADNFDDDDDSVWPQPTPYTSEEACCVRLVENTRFCVIPKPKSSAGQRLQASPPFRVYPTLDDYLKPMVDLANNMGKRQIRTTPGTCFVHSSRLDLIPGWNPGDKTGFVLLWNSAQGQENSIVVQLAPCDDVPEGCIVMHRLTRSRLDLVPLVDSVHLRLLLPVEVVRGATIFTQSTAVERSQLSLEHVCIREARSGQSWRYPYEQPHLDCPFSTKSPLNSDAESSSLCASEPVQVGSFLLLKAHETDNRCEHESLFRLKWPRPSKRLSSGSISYEQFFISYSELSKIIQPFPGGMTDVDNRARLTLELRCTSQLLNLLPVTSFVPTELSEANLNRQGYRDAIVSGDSGSGKTHTALILAASARFSADCSTHYLDCKKLKEERGIRMKQILSELHEVFHQAASSEGNSLVILDDLDELAPSFEEGLSVESSAQSHQVNPVAADQSKLIADTVRLLLESYGFEQKLSIIITCRDCRSLPTSILTYRPIMNNVKTPTLTAEERERLLWQMICADRNSITDSPASEYDAVRVGRKTEGFRPRDLQVVALRVQQKLHGEGAHNSALAVAKCTELVLASYTPLRLLSNSQTASPMEWSDIGGLFQVKEDLARTILNPAKYRRIYDKAKIRLPRGVMIFGGPGCGKSYLVPALARKCGFSLITCRGPELLDRYIGASETKVRELFARARASSPSILFFDEIDSLAPRRGSDKTGVTDRVVNQLLTLLDGVEDAASGGLVYIVAATSRPDIVDPALLRPGRLEKHIYVGYPENEQEFIDLLVAVASRYPVDSETMELVTSGQLLQELNEYPHLYRLSAADIKAAFDTAQLSAIHDLLQTGSGSVNVAIGRRHLIAAIEETRPSLPERDYSTLMESYRSFRKDVRQAHPEADIVPYEQKVHHQRKELRTALR